ncbi:alpha/beta fold hydrolase [Haladaptatus sp. CMSO5]|uniref:alpha/beta fold hydrolase n=1 Tax=Haladaptatus sp. CMSO5 TaxID=3120514 RepID=UPI002FCE0869
MPRTDEFVTVADTEIHYSSWGNTDDPPVVCVHGLSRVGRDFDPLARRLADDYWVVCPDMPGRGLSEWPADDATYGPEAMGALLVAFCDALDIDTMRWVGTSMGGMLGIGLAAGPLADRITHLVVNDVGPAPSEDDAADEGLDRIIEYLTNPPSFSRFSELEAYYRETYATYSEMTDAEWRRFTRESMRRLETGAFTPAYDPRVVEPLLTAEPPADPWAMWETIEADLFILRGKTSDILAAETFEEMKARQPDAETLEIDSGHAPSLNTPEQIRPIREFFRG